MTVTKDEIVKRIQGMGYIVATPQKSPIPSFYELDDGTILSALVIVNHLLQDPTSPNLSSVNSHVNISICAPPKGRKSFQKQIAPSQAATPKIINDDVPCTVLREEFNVYNLSNNTILSVKTVVGQVRKTDLHNEHGEPIYNVECQPVFKFKTR